MSSLIHPNCDGEEAPTASTMSTTAETTETATATATTISAPPSSFLNDIPLDTIQHYISPYLEIQDVFHLLLSTKYLYQTFTDCDCNGVGDSNGTLSDSDENIDHCRSRGEGEDDGDGDCDYENSMGQTLLQEGEDVVEVFLKEEGEDGVKEEECLMEEEVSQEKDITSDNNKNEIQLKESEVDIDHVKEKDEEENQMKGVVEDITSTTGSDDTTRLSFADRFWKEKCQQRWRSVSFHHNHIDDKNENEYANMNLMIMTNKKISRWYQEYKHRHLIDKDAKRKIQLIRKLDTLGQRKDEYQRQRRGENRDNLDEDDGDDDEDELSQNDHQYKYQKALLWSNLVQNGHDAWDSMIELAKKEMAENLEHSTSNRKQHELESGTEIETEAQSQQRPKSLVVEEILEGIHRFEICREFQTLTRMEHQREQEIDGNQVDKDDDEVVESSSLEQDYSTKTDHRSTIVTLEYGAILIAKYYQSAHEIIIDYDFKHHKHNSNDEKPLSLEECVDREIEGMTNFIRNRLLERRAREELMDAKLSPSFLARRPDPNNNERNENRTNDQWPMHWILEEMKVLFQSPSQQRGNNGDNVRNSSIGPASSVPPPPPDSASKSVDTRPFIGNEQNYYSHYNSLIQHILKSRKGIPISLSILYAAIVRRVSDGVDMEAVGLPGHFMLSTKINSPSSRNGENQEQQQVFIDVFHGGAILTKQQCQILIVSRYNIAWDDAFIEPIQKTEVWCRMLRNLLNCHHRKIVSSGNGIDMFLDNIGDPAEFGDSSLDTDTKMMNAVRVLISLGFRLTRLPLDVCNHDESFTEIVMMMSTLSQS